MAVAVYNFAQIFLRFILSIIKIIVIEGGIYQIHNYNRKNAYNIMQLLIAIIALASSKTLNRSLSPYFWWDKVIFKQFSLIFFFSRFKKFFFLVRPTLFLATSFYFMNISRWTKCSHEFGLNSLIKHFVLKVYFWVLAIYLSLDEQL